MRFIISEIFRIKNIIYEYTSRKVNRSSKAGYVYIVNACDIHIISTMSHNVSDIITNHMLFPGAGTAPRLEIVDTAVKNIVLYISYNITTNRRFCRYILNFGSAIE